METATGKVDLSLASKGAVLHRRNGTTSEFDGPTPPEDDTCKTHPYCDVDGETYRQDGSWNPGAHAIYETPRDIVRVGSPVEVTPNPPEVDAERIAPAAVITGPELVVAGGGVIRKVDAGWSVPGLGEGVHGSWLARAMGCPPEDGMRVTVKATVERHVEPPKPVLTITEKRREDGWVYAWSDYSGDLKPGQSRNLLHVLLYDHQPGYVPVGRHVAIVPNGPFVCREAVWPRIKATVSEVNASA